MFYMVVRGEVQLTDSKNGPDKPPRVLVTLGEGHYFGEMALVMGEPRNCSVHCLTQKVELACLSKGDFEAGLSSVENFRSIINEVCASALIVDSILPTSIVFRVCPCLSLTRGTLVLYCR